MAFKCLKFLFGATITISIFSNPSLGLQNFEQYFCVINLKALEKKGYNLGQVWGASDVGECSLDIDTTNFLLLGKSGVEFLNPKNPLTEFEGRSMLKLTID